MCARGMEDRFQEIAKKIFEGRKISQVLFRKKVKVHDFLHEILDLLFPHLSEGCFETLEQVGSGFLRVRATTQEVLECSGSSLPQPLPDLAAAFFERLPAIQQSLQADAEAMYAGDPAAKSVEEVIIAYPGFFAIATYRIAHELSLLGVPLIPRILTEYAHQVTGIDIHPGAKIGGSFCIDHGTGIVIGETTVIGNNVKLYQGVTLGALSVSKDLASSKRHPTVEDNVVIYSYATILGGDTVIGHGSIIGGNVWLIESVPPNSKIYHRV